MSASIQATTTCPETRQFPGNCTLEMALKTVMDVYHHYSSGEGKPDFLSFNDFKKLLTEQAPIFLQACNRKNPNYLKNLFSETDLNKDREVAFEEFTMVLAKLSDDAHRLMHHQERCKPDKP